MAKNIDKNYRQLERIIKGFANHRRIAIMELLKQSPELSVLEIAEMMNINFNTASDHIRKLAITGALMKRYEGKRVRHKLTDRGEYMLKFCKAL